MKSREMLSFLTLSLLISSDFSVLAQDTSSWPAGTYVPNVCVCGSANQCSFAGVEAAFDGAGIIQPRILTNGSNPRTPLGSTNSSLCQPVRTGINLATTSQDTCNSTYMSVCCPLDGYTCGIRYPPVPNAPTSGEGQAVYGAYPFHTIVMDAETEFYLGGGVLIDQWHVLTAAHKIYNWTKPMKVRFGDWNAGESSEPLPNVESNVSAHIHPAFNPLNLRNDLAILRLRTPVVLGQYPHVGSICLTNTTLSGLRCWTSGYGRNSTDSTGRYQRILKEVDVPLVDHLTCVRALRTKLGNTFSLDRVSFLCAGGEAGKDACIGDGGSPLSCFVGNRFYLVGLTAWGVSCGEAGIPAAYVNIQSYIPWIQTMTAELDRMFPPGSTADTRTSVTTGPSSGTLATGAGAPTLAAQSGATSTTASRTTVAATVAATATTTRTTVAATTTTAKPKSPLDVCYASKPLYDYFGGYLKTACIVSEQLSNADATKFCADNGMRLWNHNDRGVTAMALQIFLEENYGFESGPWYISGKTGPACSGLVVANSNMFTAMNDCISPYTSVCELNDTTVARTVTTFPTDPSVCGSTNDLRRDDTLAYVKSSCLMAFPRNYTISEYVCRINGMTMFDVADQWTQDRLNVISEDKFDVASGVLVWINGRMPNATCKRFSGASSPFVVENAECRNNYWSYCQYTDPTLK